jgi:hypothetical protein
MMALALTLLLAQTYYTPQEALGLFNQANDAYYKQDYATAKELYTKLLEHGHAGPDVLYNLGTAYLATGDLGPAMLYLERARKLSRADDIEAHLSLAHSKQLDQVVGAASDEPFLQRLADAFDPDVLAVGFLITWWVGLVLWVVRLRRASGQRLVPSLVMAGCLLAAVASGALLANHVHILNTVKEAVVQAEVLKVRSAPSESSPIAFEVHAGLKVRVIDESGKYVRLKLPNGLDGWIEKEGVQTL